MRYNFYTRDVLRNFVAAAREKHLMGLGTSSSHSASMHLGYERSLGLGNDELTFLLPLPTQIAFPGPWKHLIIFYVA